MKVIFENPQAASLGTLIGLVLVLFAVAVAHFLYHQDLAIYQPAPSRTVFCASPLPGPDAFGRGTGCGSHY